MVKFIAYNNQEKTLKCILNWIDRTDLSITSEINDITSSVASDSNIYDSVFSTYIVHVFSACRFTKPRQKRRFSSKTL